MAGADAPKHQGDRHGCGGQHLHHREEQEVNDVEVSYVAAYDPNAKQIFSVEIQNLGADSIAVDQKSGDIYVAGDSNEAVAPNWEQTALVKLDSKGKQQWFQSIARVDKSKPGALGAKAVSLDPAGNVYIAGTSDVNVGSEIIPELFATTEYGTDASDGASGLALDAKGTIYVGGDTSGKFEHPDAGVAFDAGPPGPGFIARFATDGKPF